MRQYKTELQWQNYSECDQNRQQSLVDTKKGTLGCLFTLRSLSELQQQNYLHEAGKNLTGTVVPAAALQATLIVPS
jgi:hypothetical protein